MSEQMLKVIEKVYSLKKYRTLSYQLDKKIQASSDTLTNRKNNINSKNSIKILKSKSKNHFDLYKPMDSFINLAKGKRNFSKFYDSKPLPSQFLATPLAVLNKLTKKVYSYHRSKDIPTILPNFNETSPKMNSQNYVNLHEKNKKEDTQALLDFTCQEMLNDNKQSKKVLKIASNFLTKRAKLTTKMIDFVSKSNERAKFEEFREKLKDAHTQLVKHNKIQPKQAKTNRKIFKTFD